MRQITISSKDFDVFLKMLLDIKLVYNEKVIAKLWLNGEIRGFIQSLFLSFIIVFVLKMPIKDDPICPRNIDPFDIVSYYIKWVTASWT